MPFTTLENRQKMKKFLLSELENNPVIPEVVGGDRCYVEYKRMVEAWIEQPRWTTVDEIAKFLSDDPQERAKILAFLVFFAFYALPYEEKKRSENGDVI